MTCDVFVVERRCCCLRSFVKSPNFRAIDWRPRLSLLHAFGNHILSTVFVLFAFNSSTTVTVDVLCLWLSRFKLSTNILGCSIIVHMCVLFVCCFFLLLFLYLSFIEFCTPPKKTNNFLFFCSLSQCFRFSSVAF